MWTHVGWTQSTSSLCCSGIVLLFACRLPLTASSVLLVECHSVSINLFVAFARYSEPQLIIYAMFVAAHINCTQLDVQRFLYVIAHITQNLIAICYLYVWNIHRVGRRNTTLRCALHTWQHLFGWLDYVCNFIATRKQQRWKRRDRVAFRTSESGKELQSDGWAVQIRTVIDSINRWRISPCACNRIYHKGKRMVNVALSSDWRTSTQESYHFLTDIYQCGANLVPSVVHIIES